MSDFGRLVEAEIPRLRRYARALTPGHQGGQSATPPLGKIKSAPVYRAPADPVGLGHLDPHLPLSNARG
jgi:hypothetical protein